MKINIRYLKLSKQFLCIQLLSVYIYRQEEREDDFESKTEISLSCQLKAGKKLYTVFIYRIYHNIYCIYTHKTVTVLARPFEALSALQQINRPNSRIIIISATCPILTLPYSALEDGEGPVFRTEPPLLSALLWIGVNFVVKSDHKTESGWTTTDSLTH